MLLGLVPVLLFTPIAYCRTFGILPNIPRDIESNDIVVQVLQKELIVEEDFNCRYVEVPVIRVFHRTYKAKTVRIPLESNDCDVIGVVGEPGFVVMTRRQNVLIVASYRVRDWKAVKRDTTVIP